MNKIVREHVPISDLPEHLREGLDPTDEVRLTIESQPPVEASPEPIMTLDEMFALKRPPYRTTENIVAEIRRIRDGWDE
jgi:hypothetical protein